MSALNSATLRADASQVANASAAASLAPPAVATGVAVTTPPAAVPAATGAAAAMTTPTPTGVAGTQQAAAGAATTAAAAQPKAEAFNAPQLKLPDEPTTSEVLTGLAGAMADPTVNQTTTQRLYEFQQQLLDMQKAMTQVILDGMR